MTPAEVAAVRSAVGLTQGQLAQLLGVHPLTVSKWERSVLVPSPYQAALLHAFREAARRAPDVGARAALLIAVEGVPVALYTLLHAAFDGRVLPDSP